MFNPYQVLEKNQNIALFFEKLPRGIKGLYHNDNNGFIAILLNKNLNTVERRCVLTEELAHHFLNHYYGFSCANYFERLSCYKQERGAAKWAADKLIPDDELKEFLEHNQEAEIWDVAEQFWVTEEVVRFKMSQFNREVHE